MKYKPCCGRRCLNGVCETRDAGGCYCLCRLKDYEKGCQNRLKGDEYRTGGGIVYKPGYMSPLVGKEKEDEEENLRQIQEEIKKYEIAEDG